MTTSLPTAAVYRDGVLIPPAHELAPGMVAWFDQGTLYFSDRRPVELDAAGQAALRALLDTQLVGGAR